MSLSSDINSEHYVRILEPSGNLRQDCEISFVRVIKTRCVDEDYAVFLQKWMSGDCFYVTKPEFAGMRCQTSANFHFLLS